MTETLWQELVDRLREEHDMQGPAFAEIGHTIIAEMRSIYLDPCPCGCSLVIELRGPAPQ